MTNTAISRRSDVVSRVEGDETLVLDLQTQTAHCLSGDVAVVWSSAEKSVAEVALANGLPIASVESALASLRELGLVFRGADLTRRAVIGRGAAVGAAVIAAGVVSIPLPAAAAAASATFSITNAACVSTSASSPKTFTLNLAAGSKPLTAGATYNVTLSYSDGINTVSGSSPTSFVANGSGQIGTSGGGVTLQTTNNFGGGPITVTVTSGSETQTFASSSLTGCLKPSVTLSKISFAKNSSDSFTVTSSSGFAAGQTVTVTNTGLTAVTPSPSPVTVTTGGAIPSTTTFAVTYPSGNGSGTITFTDAYGNAATVNVNHNT